ncbi:diguanylate cyclase domain-containing protein [Vibrio sp. WJH972]
MWNSLKNTLAYRVAGSVFLLTLLLTLFLTIFFYFQLYTKEISEQNSRITQLAHTVESNAAISAYLNNQELAQEVVSGLAKNDIVDIASIEDDNDFSEQSGTSNSKSSVLPIVFELPSPFLVDDIVGRLTIIPNQSLIENNAKEIAILYSVILFFYSAIVVSMVTFLVHRQLTLPLVKMKKAVDQAAPGTDKTLTYIHRNPNDEIGLLVNHSNKLLTSIYDTLEREKTLRNKIEKVERRYRLLFEQSSVGIALVTPEGYVELCNESFDHLVQHYVNSKHKSISAIPLADMFINPDRMNETLTLVCQNDCVMAEDFRLNNSRLEERRWFHCLFSLASEDQGNQLIELVMYDISERAMREKQHQFEAEFDSLTTLYNRRAAERNMIDLLAEAQDPEHQCALILIDLDHFKPVNDQFGHEAGDLVLIETAIRLKESVSSEDLVCRWGGDEFLVILRHDVDPLSVENVISTILRNLIKPINISQSEPVVIGASLGVVLTSRHGNDRDTLVKSADEAMYLVKQNGRNGYCISGEDPVFS